ncbi:MAG: hypothetical protein PHS93_04470 [Candidatus Omnitrophica bacterium]|nr:hypothetical protein [Candidatus Omnitrophota bacterium]MDD5352405.1 hypothetical protein [Candidatus Omnitrophota bacterium]MDD5550003.1 hypothetical protein [Candidatus Omnitrophota bacterium]
MNIILIMAKEGSIGLPGKNIWTIKDKTLLEWTIEDGKKSKTVDKIFVSTNGKKTAEIGSKSGAEIIFRDNELAKNEKFMEAVDHAINYIKNKYDNLEIIAMPQCVVPFRDPDIFDKSINFLLENLQYDSVVTIRRTGYIPEALMTIRNNELVPYFPQIQSKASGSRQDSEAYEIDHTVECFRYSSWQNRDKGIKPWNYLGRRIKGIIQDYHNRNCFVDVHTPEDIEWLNFIVDHLGHKGMKAND